MAGSYMHVIDQDGNLKTNGEFVESCENLGNAYEAVEEMWYIIQILAQGDATKIHHARELYFKIMKQKYR